MKIIERSKLLQASELEQAQALSVQYPDSQGFLKALYRRKMITRWQAGQLLAGNSSFFLGKYKLVELIGAGGMGRVFRAEHTAMNRSVALKIISRELVTDPDAQKLFLNEARAIASLNHPNIVHAYSVDKEGDRYYIVMEYVEGSDLEKIVQKDGPIEQAKAARFILQAAGALHHAHERNMIHCDIKPANLLVNEADQVKILDMGLARFQSKSDSKGKRGMENAADPANEEEGTPQIIGTVDYMAPEVAEDQANASPLSDIYSLGCVMYFLLTGQIPFPGDTIPERIIKHQCGEPKDPQELQPELSSHLCEICLKMMAREPSERFQNGEEIMEALSKWLAESRHEDSEGSSISLDFSQFIQAGDPHSSRIGASKKSGFFGKSGKQKKSEETEAAEGSWALRESTLQKTTQDERSAAQSSSKNETEKDIPDFGMLGELVSGKDAPKEDLDLPDFLGMQFGKTASGSKENVEAPKTSGSETLNDLKTKKENEERENEPAVIEETEISKEPQKSEEGLSEELKFTESTPKSKKNAEKEETGTPGSAEPSDRLILDETEKNEESDDTVIASDEELAEAAASVNRPDNSEKSKPQTQDLMDLLKNGIVQEKSSEEELDVPETFSLSSFEPRNSHSKKSEKEGTNEDLLKSGSEKESDQSARPVLKKPRQTWKNTAGDSGIEAPKKTEKAHASGKNTASGGKVGGLTAVLAKSRDILARLTAFWGNLTKKQKLLFGGIGGGILLILLIVLILIFCLGGEDPAKTAPAASVNESEEVIEEVVEDVSEDDAAKDAAKEADPENAEAAENADGSDEAKGSESDGAGNSDEAGNASGDESGDDAVKKAPDGEEKSADGGSDEESDGKSNGKTDETEDPADAAGKENAETAGNGGDENTVSTDGSSEETTPNQEDASAESIAENADGTENASDENAGADADSDAVKAEEEAKKAEEEKAKAEAEAKAKEEEEARKKAEEEAKAKEEEEKAKAEEEARKKEAAEPFKNSPSAVELPALDGEKLELTQISHAGMDVSVSLLGGETAFPVKSSGKKPGTQTKFFTISETDGDVPTWEIRYRMREEESLAATLTLEENSLYFQWNAAEEIPPKDLPVLGNCALKLTCNEKEHVLALRQAVELETLVLGGKTGGATVKSGKLEIPFPSLETVYVEIVRVGKFPEDAKVLQLPEPMKASELSKRNPLTVNFKFEDANGNAQNPLIFQFVPIFSNNFAGTLTPVLSIPGGSLMKQIEMAKNPQIDIQVTDWKKQITAIEKKNEDVAAHARSPQDTAKVAQLELQIWFVDVLKQLDGADFEYRIYADLDGNQVDLVTSRYISPEDKKAAKKTARSSKGRRAQNDGGDSEENSEEAGGFGGFEGMKF